MENIITKDPEILSGMPVFTGTRVPVQNLIDYFKTGLSINDFLDDFPGVKKEDVITLIGQFELYFDTKSSESNKEAA